MRDEVRPRIEGDQRAVFRVLQGTRANKVNVVTCRVRHIPFSPPCHRVGGSEGHLQF